MSPYVKRFFQGFGLTLLLGLASGCALPGGPSYGHAPEDEPEIDMDAPGDDQPDMAQSGAPDMTVLCGSNFACEPGTICVRYVDGDGIEARDCRPPCGGTTDPISVDCGNPYAMVPAFGDACLMGCWSPECTTGCPLL